MRKPSSPPCPHRCALRAPPASARPGASWLLRKGPPPTSSAYLGTRRGTCRPAGPPPTSSAYPKQPFRSHTGPLEPVDHNAPANSAHPRKRVRLDGTAAPTPQQAAPNPTAHTASMIEPDSVPTPNITSNSTDPARQRGGVSSRTLRPAGEHSINLFSDTGTVAPQGFNFTITSGEAREPGSLRVGGRVRSATCPRAKAVCPARRRDGVQRRCSKLLVSSFRRR